MKVIVDGKWQYLGFPKILFREISYNSDDPTLFSLDDTSNNLDGIEVFWSNVDIRRKIITTIQPCSKSTCKNVDNWFSYKTISLMLIKDLERIQEDLSLHDTSDQETNFHYEETKPSRYWDLIKQPY